MSYEIEMWLCDLREDRSKLVFSFPIINLPISSLVLALMAGMDGNLCEGCSRAVQEHRSNYNGKNSSR